MAKVKQSYVGTLNGGTTIGIQLPILVNSGADGSYVIAANQIAWGESHFYNETFGGTTEGLLTAIENTISTYAGDAIHTAYARANEAYTYASNVGYFADIAFAYANGAYARANAAYTYASNVGSVADGAYARANAAYSYGRNADNHASRAYTYASNVGAVADAASYAAYYAKERIDTFLDGEGLADTVDSLRDIQDYIKTHGTDAANMVTNITAAQNRADAAYSYAGSAYARANEAYNLAGDAAENVLTLAYDAIDSKADEVRSQAYYRANEIETSIRSGELATEIRYTFESAASSQGKFISSVAIIPNRDMPNDFEFRFTYYTPKAEDYWEEYIPAN